MAPSELASEFDEIGFGSEKPFSNKITNSQEDLQNIFKLVDDLEKGDVIGAKADLAEAVKKMSERTDLNAEERLFVQMMDNVIKEGRSAAVSGWHTGSGIPDNIRNTQAIVQAGKVFKDVFKETDPQKRQLGAVNALSEVMKFNEKNESLTDGKGLGKLDNLKKFYEEGKLAPQQAVGAPQQAQQQVQGMNQPQMPQQQSSSADQNNMRKYRDEPANTGIFVELIKLLMNVATLGLLRDEIEKLGQRSQNYKDNYNSNDFGSVLLSSARPNVTQAASPKSEAMQSAIEEAKGILGLGGQAPKNVAREETQEVEKASNEQESSLAKAIAAGDEKAVEEHFQNTDNDVNAVDENGKTALDHVMDRIEQITNNTENSKDSPQENKDIENASKMLAHLADAAERQGKATGKDVEVKTGGEVEAEKAKTREEGKEDKKSEASIEGGSKDAIHADQITQERQDDELDSGSHTR